MTAMFPSRQRLASSIYTSACSMGTRVRVSSNSLRTMSSSSSTASSSSSPISNAGPSSSEAQSSVPLPAAASSARPRAQPISEPRNLPPTPISELPSPRTFKEADEYFQRLAGDGPRIPSEKMRWLTVAGWVGGALASSYMILYADFGTQEHVFSPVRRVFHEYTNSIFSLSDSERNRFGMDQPLRPRGGELERTTEQRPE